MKLEMVVDQPSLFDGVKHHYYENETMELKIGEKTLLFRISSLKSRITHQVGTTSLEVEAICTGITDEQG